ncbi:glutathione S-transferase 4-like [Watersipora subatra]|uniref:glutathione S-transferase 4-like n=1 Tax=Watersipora subatra TaxID=2589382 RepID=UPI00355B4AD6
MAEETYKLIYFDLKARAEPARAMFFMAGQKFEDVRILFQDWGKLKTQTPLGFLPILETSKGALSQTSAINYYLANKLGFLPEDEYEKAQSNSISLTITDLGNHLLEHILLSELYKLRPSPNDIEEKKKTVREKLIQTQSFVETFCKNGNKFIFGDKVTVSDIELFTLWTFISPIYPLAEFKNAWLEEFMDNMKADPKFAEYLAQQSPDIVDRLLQKGV